MGYKVLGKTEDLLRGYEPRKGLEGPFLTPRSLRVVYYDPKEGAYWDPSTDFYIPYEEFAAEARDALGKGWI